MTLATRRHSTLEPGRRVPGSGGVSSATSWHAGPTAREAPRGMTKGRTLVRPLRVVVRAPVVTRRRAALGVRRVDVDLPGNSGDRGDEILDGIDKLEHPTAARGAGNPHRREHRSRRRSCCLLRGLPLRFPLLGCHRSMLPPHQLPLRLHRHDVGRPHERHSTAGHEGDGDHALRDELADTRMGHPRSDPASKLDNSVSGILPPGRAQSSQRLEEDDG